MADRVLPGDSGAHMGGPAWEHAASLAMKIALTVLGVFTVVQGEWVWAVGVFLGLGVTLMPTVLARDYNVHLPWIMDAALTVAVFLHVVGGYESWYHIPHFDNLTHFISSVTISLIGVMFLYMLQFYTKVVRLPPLGFGVFTVLFAISVGVFWEFLEFGLDLALGTHYQKGNTDTMVDLMFDTAAGAVVGAIAAVRMRQGQKRMAKYDIVIGDIKGSRGYQRWMMLTDKEQGLQEKIRAAFMDPGVLEHFFDYVVSESRHITEEERKAWRSFMDGERKVGGKRK